MTDFHSMTLDKHYSEITNQELIDNPHIRPFYIEYVLSYFFGDTKLSLNGTEYKIQLLNHKWTKTFYLQTHFSETEVVKLSFEEYMRRCWLLIFNFEIQINATKKSR